MSALDNGWPITLNIAYRTADRRALLTWNDADANSPWLPVLVRLFFDNCEDATQEGPNQLSLAWWAFSGLRAKLLDIFQGFRLKLGSEITVESRAATLLQQATRNANDYQNAKSAPPVPTDKILEQLKSHGFARALTIEQSRNVCKLAGLPAGATFSVPGAGKTTEALAVFFYRAKQEERLLVVAPKNAFAAWDEQLNDCIPHSGEEFVRLRGGEDRIRRQLDADPRFSIITYQQLTRVQGLLADHVSRFPTHMFLDESHRIKSGIERQTPRAVLTIAHLPVSKLIMSGTPMPQAIDDLIPQFTFLYPEVSATPESVVDLMRPVYVRTTKGELGLPPAERGLTTLPMAPVQAMLYRLMRSEVAREAAAALNARSRMAFRRLGRSVAQLLQFVSNPSLLSDQIGFAHSELLGAVLAEGESPKIRHVVRRAREITRNGEKVLIWNSFVENVEYLAARLADLGAVYIHGGVDAGEEDDDETREGRIKLFHDDPNVLVLVANPAAAAEGISLHKICHHALYLDRTFNAAHYLQSEDRIHRLGLPPGQRTIIEIVECAETIDQTVRNRLGEKVALMAASLEDSSLGIDPLPLDPPTPGDPDELVVGLVDDDVRALLNDLAGGDGR